MRSTNTKLEVSCPQNEHLSDLVGCNCLSGILGAFSISDSSCSICDSRSLTLDALLRCSPRYQVVIVPCCTAVHVIRVPLEYTTKSCSIFSLIGSRYHEIVAVIAAVFPATARSSILLPRLRSIDPAQSRIFRVYRASVSLCSVVGLSVNPVTTNRPVFNGLRVGSRLLWPSKFANLDPLTNESARSAVVIKWTVVTGSRFIVSRFSRREKYLPIVEDWRQFRVRR